MTPANCPHEKFEKTIVVRKEKSGSNTVASYFCFVRICCAHCGVDMQFRGLGLGSPISCLASISDDRTEARLALEVAPLQRPSMTKVKAKAKTKKKSKKSKKPDPWGKAYDVLCGLVKKRMKKAGYKEFYVTYSVLDHNENDKARAPIDNLDETAFEGKGRITYQGFGENRYTSDELDSPTWFELCVEAEKAIRFTDDHHHIFFEGVKEKEDGLYELFMGS